MTNSIQNIFWTFLGNFIAGGLLVGISAVAVKFVSGGLGGFLYGALPLGFIYLYIFTYLTFSKDIDKNAITESLNLADGTIYGAFIWILYIFIVLLLTKYTNLPKKEYGYIWIVLITVIIYAFILISLYKIGQKDKITKFFVTILLLFFFINLRTFNIATYFLENKEKIN